MIKFNGNSLTIRHIYRIAEELEETGLDVAARRKVEANRKSLDIRISSGERLYGINTGFGKLFNVDIDSKELEKLQINLIRSHAAGTGDPLSPQHVRSMMAVRANSLSKGFSGIRPVVVESIVQALNASAVPYVPSIGSVGASGDLAPLAHVALALMGEGRFISDSGWINASELLRQKGLMPLSLSAKEGVAFINGTAGITGILSFELYRAFRLLNAALASAALSFTAMRGNLDAFTGWAVETRPHPGQIQAAAKFREIMEGSDYTAANLQDPYSFRCIPQVYGAVLDTLNYARLVAERELNSVTDNPLVGEQDIISAGNFHGEPVALVSDFLAIALTDLGNIIERRIARVVDSNLSGLPGFLTEHEGLQSGYMIPQYTAAALCNANKVLSTPSSADTIPTSANQEDHVSMGATSALKLSRVVDNLYSIVSIDLLLGAQALDLSKVKASGTVKNLLDLIRGHVEHLAEDRPPYEDMEKLRESLLHGGIGKTCDSIVSFYD